MIQNRAGFNSTIESASYDQAGYNLTLGDSFPPELVSFYNAFFRDGSRPEVGTEAIIDYPDESGVSVDAAKGLDCSGEVTNLFQTLVAESVMLFEAGYCLQVFGTGSVTCSYGTATVGSPLQFIATVGLTLFTPTGIVNWMLNADGGYVFPEVPIATTADSKAATDEGEGFSLLMKGSAESRALIECYRGETDGVELNPNPDFADDSGYLLVTGVTIEDGILTAVNATGNVQITSLGTTIGERYLIDIVTDVVSGSIWPRVGFADVGSYAIDNLMDDRAPQETVCGGNDDILYLSFASCTCTIDLFAVEKLLPSTLTLSVTGTMAIGSNELTNGDSFNVTSSSDDTTIPLYYGKDGTGSYIATSDGTNTHKVYTTWDQGAVLAMLVQTNTTGTQLQVGYRNLSLSEASFTKSSFGAFTGTFTPSDYDRFALDNIGPFYIQQKYNFNVGEYDEDILNALIDTYAIV